MTRKFEPHLSLSLSVNGQQLSTLWSEFPGGESYVRIDELPVAPADCLFRIDLNFRSNKDLIDLLLLTDAVRRHWGPVQRARIYLVMNYLPYARQDRVCSPGESLSVKVVADLINSQNYEWVECMNLHSDVAGSLIDNLHHLQLTELIAPLRFRLINTMLVSPDAGAAKKVRYAAESSAWKGVIYADKVRDVATGDITGTSVHSEHLGDQDLLIVDDICDGGRTFIELAKVLRTITTGRLYLYVTHGIFSNGTATVTQHFDKVFTSNLIGNPNPNLEEI
jgi:ribose-phosphate pyrophosphokinase